MTTAPAPVHASTAFDRDRFLLKQKHLALTETYRVFDEDGAPVMFVKREGRHLRQIAAFFGALLAGAIVGCAFIIPATMLDGRKYETLMLVLVLAGALLAIVAMIVVGVVLMPKRHIGLFADESMRHELIKIYQDQKIAFINATYTVADADFNLIGWLRKNYLYNVIRKRWYVYGPDDQVCAIAMEDSMALSIIRRALGVVDGLGGLIRTNFNIYASDGATKLGEFNRKITILDRYVLDMSEDERRLLDRRLAVALGVMLDTGERR
ncbi:MAG TPA: hypothetical protein VMS30_06405 [Phycisphaerales bacterium]|nr:hypothetical protein [Phycisphaerales bacterium]